MSPDNSQRCLGHLKDVTFMPHDLPSRADMLLEEVSKKLQTSFLGLCLWVSAKQPDLYAASGLANYLEEFKSLPVENRRRLVEYPPFRIWHRQTIYSLESATEMKEKLADLKRIMWQFQRGSGHALLETGCGRVEVLRYDADPLIAQAAQAYYRFPDEARRKEFDEEVAYPFSLFVEMLKVALERIRRTWFEAYRDFFKFVKIVVDMIDAVPTSYSSQEHTGVIFVSTDASSLIELEEYLIHEFGHQVLDNLMELDPLTTNENSRQAFKLPWSGKEREIYGYFHAFYIYLLLLNYYSRIKARSLKEQRRVSERRAHILDGLVRAVPELEDANLFTPTGKQLFENLKAEVRRFGELHTSRQS